MPLLFSYGTLQDEEVQFALFGRRLVGRKAHLLGYAQEGIQLGDAEFTRGNSASRFTILRIAHSQAAPVEGTVFEVTERELELADEYEPAEYKRVEARLASGEHTWVYVDARSADVRA